MCAMRQNNNNHRQTEKQTNRTKQQQTTTTTTTKKPKQTKKAEMKRYMLDLPNCFKTDNTATLNILLFLIRKNIFQRGFKWTEYVFLFVLQAMKFESVTALSSFTWIFVLFYTKGTIAMLITAVRENRKHSYCVLERLVRGMYKFNTGVFLLHRLWLKRTTGKNTTGMHLIKFQRILNTLSGLTLDVSVLQILFDIRMPIRFTKLVQ